MIKPLEFEIKISAVFGEEDFNAIFTAWASQKLIEIEIAGTVRQYRVGAFEGIQGRHLKTVGLRCDLYEVFTNK